MKKVYIAHPLRGDIANNELRIAQVCRDIADNQPGILPLSPVLAFDFFNPETEPEKAMEFCLELLSCCDELWVYGEWWKSEGCLAEMCYARCRGITMRFINTVPGITGRVFPETTIKN